MITIIVDNGFRSVTELKGIKLSQLDFLNMAEKGRIKPLLGIYP